MAKNKKIDLNNGNTSLISRQDISQLSNPRTGHKVEINFPHKDLLKLQIFAQILVSKYHSILKGMRVLWRKDDSGTGVKKI